MKKKKDILDHFLIISNKSSNIDIIESRMLFKSCKRIYTPGG